MTELYVSTPSFYINKKGAIESLAETLKKAVPDGKKAFIIWSPKAREAAGERILKQLESISCSYEENIFSGYPTQEKARRYAELFSAAGADFFIAAGGGRTLDTAKAAGTFAHARVVTVPTIAATCAAWAAVSILYNDDGSFDKGLFNPASPVAIIADSQIIASAPDRYIKAGLADTLAKWYEPPYRDGTVNAIARYGAKLAADIILKDSAPALKETDLEKKTEKSERLIDSIIYLAGFVGSFIGEAAYGGLAHPFYFAARSVPKVRESLHGEVVAYGLILQAFYEHKNHRDLLELTDILYTVDNLFTSSEIGLVSEGDLQFTAHKMAQDFKYAVTSPEDERRLLEAFTAADEFVKGYRCRAGKR